ncbi:MAG: efflux RND transporter periplasmic adaptor subunit [Puniceicoccaceae bacterium]
MSRRDVPDNAEKKPARTWLRAGLALLVIVLVLAWQADLFVSRIAPGEVARERSGAAGIAFVEVEETSVPAERIFTGSVEPRIRIESAPRIGGTVEEVPVEAGDRVRKGDLLIRLDRAAPRARRDEAEAALREAEAARRGAVALLERIARATGADALPETRRIEAEQSAETAARAVERARAALRSARIQLDYTEIRSTRDAVVMETLLEVGDQAMPGRPAVLSYDPAGLELAAHVPASMVRHFPPGAEVACRFPARALRLSGTVRAQIPRADPRTRTVEVKIAIHPAEDLVPGMYGVVAVEGEPRRALRVPEEAVERIRQLDSVRVLDERNRPYRRFVRTGKAAGGRIEILAGLRPGERVVLPAEEPADAGALPDAP